ncbi:hypothetical protein [Actinomadura latina]|uniref:Uncharacterized protein n=1 Tax=Actinomadura latina TaxID=163603 RepID=A0A846YYT1_9ACTN|nr:hypothetical protein [Actinomadura latina]NKZ03744.1 hypothetical protein [Actinomadura latina]
MCAPCRSLLAGHLAGLPALYLACEQDLEVRRQHPIGMVRGRRPRGICLDDVTATVRSDTVRVLSSWCEMIIDERGAMRLGRLDVQTLTSFLQAHLDWLARHEAVADFAEEMAALVADAKRALDPARGRTVDLGRCATDGCGGTVRATVGAGGQGAVPQVRCDAGHSWQPRQWLDLRRRLDVPAGGAAAGRSTP